MISSAECSVYAGMVSKVKITFPGDRVVILDLFQRKDQSPNEMLLFPFQFWNTESSFYLQYIHIDSIQWTGLPCEESLILKLPGNENL